MPVRRPSPSPGQTVRSSGWIEALQVRRAVVRTGVPPCPLPSSGADLRRDPVSPLRRDRPARGRVLPRRVPSRTESGRPCPRPASLHRVGSRCGHGGPRLCSAGRPYRSSPGGPVFRPRPEISRGALHSGDPLRRCLAGRGAGSDRKRDFLHIRDGPGLGGGGRRRPKRLPERRPGRDRRAGGDRPEPDPGSSVGKFGKRRYYRNRGDDGGIESAPKGRGAEGWNPASAGPAPGTDRRFPCRLHRQVRLARIRPARRAPGEPRLAGLQGDLFFPTRMSPSGKRPSSGNRFSRSGRARGGTPRGKAVRGADPPEWRPSRCSGRGWWKASSSRFATRRAHGRNP